MSGVLAAVVAPVPAAQAQGEATATAHFRAAMYGLQQAPARPVHRLRRLATAPIAAMGIAGVVLAGGGVSLAASHGQLHLPFTGHDARSDNAPDAPATANPGLTRGPSRTPGSPAGGGAVAGPQGKPTPSLPGLCRAFQAGAVKHVRTNPAFAALTTAAGSTSDIDAFCVDLIGAPKVVPVKPTPTHPVKPTPTSTPTHPVKPTQAATPSRGSSPTHPNR